MAALAATVGAADWLPPAAKKRRRARRLSVRPTSAFPRTRRSRPARRTRPAGCMARSGWKRSARPAPTGAAPSAADRPEQADRVAETENGAARRRGGGLILPDSKRRRGAGLAGAAISAAAAPAPRAGLRGRRLGRRGDELRHPAVEVGRLPALRDVDDRALRELARQDRQEGLPVGVVQRVEALVADQPFRPGEEQPRIDRAAPARRAPRSRSQRATLVEAAGEAVEPDAPERGPQRRRRRAPRRSGSATARSVPDGRNGRCVR